MKRISSFTLIAFSILFFGFTTPEKPKTLDDLGKEIFEAINNKDLKMVKSFIVTAEEIESTIDNSDMAEDKKTVFKSQFADKITTDMDKTVLQIEKGFNEIRKNIKSKKCKGGVTIGQITPKTNKLRNLPIELGDLEILYSCKDDIEKINVEVIKTDAGWRILEKLRLVYKER